MDEDKGLTEQEIIDRERRRCWRLCENWIATFKDTDIQFTSPRDYATDAIRDIMDLIVDGQDIGQHKPESPAQQ